MGNSVSSKIGEETVAIYFNSRCAGRFARLSVKKTISTATREIYGEFLVEALNYRWSWVQNALQLPTKIKAAKVYDIALIDEDIESCKISFIKRLDRQRFVYEIDFPRLKIKCRISYMCKIRLQYKLNKEHIRFAQPELLDGKFWIKFYPGNFYPVPKALEFKEGERVNHTNGQQDLLREWVASNFSDLRRKFCDANKEAHTRREGRNLSRRAKIKGEEINVVWIDEDIEVGNKAVDSLLK